MNYMLDMLDKINVLENKEAILQGAEEIVNSLLEKEKSDKSEKWMTIELAMTQLNYKLYNVNKERKKENA